MLWGIFITLECKLALLCCSVAKLYPTLQPHWLQYTRLPCHSLSPGVSANSCPLSEWCYLTISSYAALFSFCLQFLPSIRVLSSELVLLIRWPRNWSFSISSSNEYSGLISFRIDWFDLLAIQGTLKSSPAPQFESINSSAHCLLYGPIFTTVYDYWKNHSSDYMDLCWKMMALTKLSVCQSLPSKEHMSFNFMAAVTLSTVILESKKIKSVIAYTFSPFICHEVMVLDAMILGFWMLSFKSAFSSLFSPSSKGSFVSLWFLPLEWYYLHIWCYFFW